jgi:glucose/mannose-6-phosphate isomerase
LLDDLKYIDSHDTLDMLGQAARSCRALGESYRVPPVSCTSSNIIVTGNARIQLAARIIQDVVPVSVPIEILTNARLPSYVSASTLCIAQGYDEPAPQLAAMLGQAAERGAQICLLGSSLASFEQAPIIIEFKGPSHPYVGLWQAIGGLMELLESISCIAAGSVAQLKAVLPELQEAADKWAATVAISANLAKQLANECIGTSVVIYAGPHVRSAAQRWKTGINELAHQLAWANEYPAFTNSELAGWTAQPIDKPYRVIELHSNFDDAASHRQWAATKRLLSGRMPEPIIVQSTSSSPWAELLQTCLLGDFVSIYLAVATGLQPGDRRIFEQYNKRMEE